MRGENLVGRLGAAGLLCLTPLTLGAIGPTTNYPDRVLAEQNRERIGLGLAPLVWNDSLAASAQAWADHLVRSRTFAHAPQRLDDPEGENLWAGTRGYYSAEAMVGGWLAEKRNYQPGVFPFNSRTGRVEDVGHYTQIVWRGSTEVGCALASNDREDVLVCRYSKAGNWIGDRPY